VKHPHPILFAFLSLGALGASEPVVTQPPPAETSSPRTRAGTRVARVEDTIPRWDALVRLGAGYDSNALQLDDRSVADGSTPVIGSEATVGWRAHADEEAVVRLTGTVAYDHRPQLEDLDSARLGVGLTGTRQLSGMVGGGSLNLQRYWIDGKGAAFELRTGLGLGWLRQDAADLLALEAALLPFDSIGDGPSGLGALAGLDGRDDHSGFLGAASWRHWWMLSAWRIEGGLRGGLFEAQIAEESYLFAAPWAALRWRTPAWQADSKLSWDGRRYDGEWNAGEGAERSQTLQWSANLDRQVVDQWWLGVVGGAGMRASSSVDRDYQRWLVGLRVTWNFHGN
jgi:hypothetical protein